MSKKISLFANFLIITLMFIVAVGCSSVVSTDVTNNLSSNISSNESISNNALPNDTLTNNSNTEKTPPKIIFVLDASGSMWGKVGNEAKIVSAKTVLKKAISDLPDDSQVGLIAYGHRSKSDCNDIETISPLKPIDKNGLNEKIDALDAKGKTPITESLRKAIAEVKTLNLDDTVKVVLVSDGLETCEGDPCKLVKEAKEAGVKITVHVIGFDTGKLNVEQLECIAQAGGGLYMSADNADQLGSALDQAVAADVAEYNNFISVKSLADGKLTDAMVTVTNVATGEDVVANRTYEDATTNPRLIPLPVGTYNVTVKSIKIDGSPTITFEKIEVKEGEKVEKIADFSAGFLIAKVTLNGKLQDATVKIYSESTKKLVTTGRTYKSQSASMRILPGRYYAEIQPLAVEGIEQITIKDVVVKSGDKETLIEYNFEAGTLRIGTKRGTELIDSVVSVKDAATGKAIAGGRTYTSASSNPKEFIIKPGTYRVEVRAVKPPGIPPKEITVTVKKGETTEQVIDY